MKIHKIEDTFEIKKPVLTVGTFDGVHLGHKMLINKLVSKAKKINGESVIITLWPHPRVVLNDNKYEILFLNQLDEKSKKLEELGVDHLIIIPFSKEFSQKTSEEFVKEILVDKININHLIVGYDHHFGRNREGSFENLKKYSTKYNFSIEQLEKKELEEYNISSTSLRNHILNSEIEIANKLLGYNYHLNGVVIKGNQLGRKINFPTANILIEYKYKLIPSNGVYAVNIKLNNKIFNGMLNIGTRPTIDNNDTRSIEVNIFDFDQDIYGENIEIEFRKFIRNEKKHKNIEGLKAQLEIDKQIILQYFNS